MASKALRHLLIYIGGLLLIFGIVPLGFILGWMFAIAYPAYLGERAIKNHKTPRQLH